MTMKPRTSFCRPNWNWSSSAHTHTSGRVRSLPLSRSLFISGLHLFRIVRFRYYCYWMISGHCQRWRRNCASLSKIENVYIYRLMVCSDGRSNSHANSLSVVANIHDAIADTTHRHRLLNLKRTHTHTNTVRRQMCTKRFILAAEKYERRAEHTPSHFPDYIHFFRFVFLSSVWIIWS